MSKKKSQPVTPVSDEETKGVSNEPRDLKRKLRIQSVLVFALALALLFQMGQLYRFQSRINFIDQLGVERGVDLDEEEALTEDPDEVSLNALMFDFVSNLGAYEENKLRYEQNLEVLRSRFEVSDWSTYGLTLENVEGVYKESALEYSFKDVESGVTLATLSLSYDGQLSVSTYNAELTLQDKSSAEATLGDLDVFFQTNLNTLRETLEKVLGLRTELASFLQSEPIQTLLNSKGMSVGAETETDIYYSLLVLNPEQTSLAEFRISKTSAGVVLETLEPAEVLTFLVSDLDSQEAVLSLLESVDARTVLQKKVDEQKAEIAEIMQDQAFISTLSAVGLHFGPTIETDTQIQYPVLNSNEEVLRILLLDKTTGEVNVSLPDGDQVQSLSYATELLESSSKKKLSTYPV